MGNNEIVKKKQTISEFFTNKGRQVQLAMALPKVGITKDRMLRLMFSALNTTPKLFECTPETLFNSMIQCASLGLEPNTALGQAYLIPFRNNKKECVDVQLIIGYKGFLSLARRSGELSSISSHVVRDGDIFEYEFGTNEHLKHIPKWDNLENRSILFAYSVAKFKDGSVSFEIMSVQEIEKIRKRSKSANNGPWITDYEQMCRKTVIRRHMNYLPISTELSTELARAIKIDGENDAGIKNLNDILDVEITRPTEEKKGALETMAEMENLKPKETTSKEMLDDFLNITFADDLDEKEKWLIEKTGGKAKMVESLTEEQAISLLEEYN